MNDDKPNISAPPWHELTAETVLTRLDSQTAGLSEADAEERRRIHGPNRLPRQAGPHPLLRFVRHFHNILIYVLLVAAAITAGLGHLTDTLVILAVVLANAIIGFVQEGKAERAMEAIRDLLAAQTSVVRDGQRRTVAVDETGVGRRQFRLHRGRRA